MDTQESAVRYCLDGGERDLELLGLRFRHLGAVAKALQLASQVPCPAVALVGARAYSLECSGVGCAGPHAQHLSKHSSGHPVCAAPTQLFDVHPCRLAERQSGRPRVPRCWTAASCRAACGHLTLRSWRCGLVDLASALHATVQRLLHRHSAGTCLLPSCSVSLLPIAPYSWRPGCRRTCSRCGRRWYWTCWAVSGPAAMRSAWWWGGLMYSPP